MLDVAVVTCDQPMILLCHDTTQTLTAVTEITLSYLGGLEIKSAAR